MANPCNGRDRKSCRTSTSIKSVCVYARESKTSLHGRVVNTINVDRCFPVLGTGAGSDRPYHCHNNLFIDETRPFGDRNDYRNIFIVRKPSNS